MAKVIFPELINLLEFVLCSTLMSEDEYTLKALEEPSDRSIRYRDAVANNCKTIQWISFHPYACWCREETGSWILEVDSDLDASQMYEIWV